MDRIQGNEEDVASLQYARRLQFEYDTETPNKRKGGPDRSLLEDQKQAFEATAAHDKAKTKAKAKTARQAVEAARQAVEAERQAVEVARQAVEAERQAVEEAAPQKPSMAEMREIRIKALSRPSAN